jgi:two-component system alkaline phosphatase synthesis response regulator PhoP
MKLELLITFDIEFRIINMSNATLKILLVDDEPDILEFLGHNLKREGYDVYLAGNGKEALDIAMKVKPHLIILDVMMPDLDGIETCKEIRAKDGLKNVLIAFLTARGEDYSQIAGFDAGADDYITKPVKPRVFVSRIKALLRRYSEEEKADGSEMELGDLKINRERYSINYKNEDLQLPKKEFELIYLLASKPGKVFTRDEILKTVWGDDVIVGDRTIDVHIRKIREKLDDRFIRTVKGVGYKFEF